MLIETLLAIWPLTIKLIILAFDWPITSQAPPERLAAGHANAIVRIRRYRYTTLTATRLAMQAIPANAQRHLRQPKLVMKCLRSIVDGLAA
jgi:hypothetical protein